eukprot:TRINITY_DN11424_c0_g1_i1.p1 TRINITY_DN11424_c0_g1~~TRINITY_DN11424_c0_g1_i1.p1  ORF type:complete len:412 (-),score=64.24 TRINITY_DN11424_c0_g1_i1:187-1335(-)
MREPGKKILMSGGSRCNLLPVSWTPSDYHSSSMASAKVVLKHWPVEDCKRWFTEDMGLKLAKEVETNKWFPEDNSARSVRDGLVRLAQRLGVNIVCDTKVNDFQRNENNTWDLCDDKNRVYHCQSLIVTSGGLSFPKVGTDGIGHKIITRATPHTLVEPYPALVPFKGVHPGVGEPLHGISLDVDIKVKSKVNSKILGNSVSQGFLFTHKGFSGPAILNLSHYKLLETRGGPEVAYLVNWGRQRREIWEDEFQNLPKNGNKHVSTVVSGVIPKRLADAICAEAGVLNKKVNALRREERSSLVTLLTAYELNITGDMGWNMAEVSGGGVPMSEVNPHTMESKLAPRLFLAGEILDAFGNIGGFNFYWAWVTGKLAGINAAQLS